MAAVKLEACACALKPQSGLPRLYKVRTSELMNTSCRFAYPGGMMEQSKLGAAALCAHVVLAVLVRARASSNGRAV